jgi:hypothetical protein
MDGGGGGVGESLGAAGELGGEGFSAAFPFPWADCASPVETAMLPARKPASRVSFFPITCLNLGPFYCAVSNTTDAEPPRSGTAREKSSRAASIQSLRLKFTESQSPLDRLLAGFPLQYP